MQPYFFPYIGYFQLIHAVDTFVVYDDVNYIKRGWINRNNILADGEPARISLETSGASQNKLINQVKVGNNRQKLLKTIKQRYGAAPHCGDVLPVLERILASDETNLAAFLYEQLRELCQQLSLYPDWCVSSTLSKDNSLKGEDKIIAICELLGADQYVNPVGGRELYRQEAFREHGIKLSFLEAGATSYSQFQHDFVPSLSIIDILMFNDLQRVNTLLGEYSLAA